MPIYFGVLALAVLLSLAVWGAILWWVSRALEPADYVPTPTAKGVSAIGRVAFQLIVASLIAVVYLSGAPGRSAADWLLALFFAPIAAPAIVLFLWNSYFSFLALLIPAAFAFAAVAAFAWIKLVPGRWRLLWPTIAVLCFSVTCAALAQYQFQRDVAAAAKKLAPDCLDGGTIRDAIQAARGRYFGLHARAAKGDEVYGWSFRQRDFYKLPKSIARNVSSRREALLPDYPSCWPSKAPKR